MKLGNIENDNDFKCTICNSWTGKNKASLGAHIRNCRQNLKKNTEISNDNILNEELITNIVVEPINLSIEPIEQTFATKKGKSKQTKK